MKRIGMVGLGLLGGAVASRLLEGGFDLAGYDLREERIEALVPEGLQPAGSIAEAAAGADAVFTVLPSLESVDSAIRGAGGLIETAPRGAVLIQMSTISPELTRGLCEASLAHGLDFLDTPISGTSAMVARGDCTILAGGEREPFNKCQPIFAAIARRTEYIGAAGTASLAKLATNLLVALNTAALAEAMVLCEKGGLDLARMVSVWAGSAGDSRMAEIRGPLMAAGEFPPQMKLELFLKDLRLILDEGRNLGVPLALTETAQELYSVANHEGMDQQDIAGDITILKKRAGLSNSGS